MVDDKNGGKYSGNRLRSRGNNKWIKCLDTLSHLHFIVHAWTPI